MKAIILAAITAVVCASCTTTSKETCASPISVHNHAQCHMAETIKAIQDNNEHASVEWRELTKK